jgi:hypothetical protein
MNGFISVLIAPDGRLHGILSEQEAGRYLDLAPGTLRNWRMSGRGPRYVQFGRRIGYRVEDLQVWAEQRLTDGRGR